MDPADSILADPLLLPPPEAAAAAAKQQQDSDSPLAGVSDYRGRPVCRRNSGGWRSAFFVVGMCVAVEIAGSFAYFGISANLITYLTGPLGQSNASAAASVNAWSGTASLMPLLGAFLADAYLGRYTSIILACTLYVLGYGMLTLSSTVPALRPSHLPCGPSSSSPSSCQPAWPQVAFFYVSLYLIALAQGADKPCGLAFAADQFDADHPEERASRGSLFNWWFFCMAIGISVAVSVVGYVQESVGWGVGFGVPCAIVLCAFTVFLLGTPTYRLYHHTRSRSRSSASSSPSPSNDEDHEGRQPQQQSPFVRLARGLRAVIVTTAASRGRLLPQRHHKRCQWESSSEISAAASAEHDARCVLRLLPIWATSLAYGVVYAQIMTLFNKQGRTLDRRIGFGLVEELPPAALQALGPVSILLFVPVYDRALVPALRWATGNPSGLSMLQRVGAGMATSLLAVAVAALVESRRLATAREHGLVDQPGATVPMSWAWLVPQYGLMGVADVLAVVGLQELFYDQMPDGLRSLGLALYLSVMGIGGFISSLLISTIDAVTGSGGAGDSWFADNLNRAHLDYFYWLLAGLSAVELALYIAFARSYVYKHHKPSY
ncbi:Protein NRT1/ PTR FAMILY 5.10 [Dichanthelium oligosanthes]|uniref:Protein NRT1/ PTR FAMILY 5.10 n=1 Tax=Dichanthelium oligosanthes TaxID=888268 RepID=A0A1E5WJJ7_9POAL|nr:Protein NRT1/ PTR FAMILY 5.10 [Dichanthelium oligosanthes]